jgi:hypothetical protein
MGISKAKELECQAIKWPIDFFTEMLNFQSSEK